MARPKIVIEQHQLEALCRLNPTLKDCAAYFKCSQDTIERRSKEFGYDSFADLRDKNMVHTRLSLVRSAVKKAENGDNTMLIFCLKNLCGWADKQETTQNQTISIEIEKEDEGL
jgi:uncharacterized protein YbcV (DUF1398 family)